MNKDDIIIQDIFEAMDRGEFVPYLHQITKAGKIVGAEVLSRWQSSKFKRVLPPFFFIREINENRELSMIFTRVMYSGLISAFEDLKEAGFDGFISFNLSATDLEPASTIPAFIMEVTPPEIIKNIILEVTSQHPIQSHHAEVSLSRASMLSDAGFKIAIDDMGSARGFNVFDLLKDLVEVVKIDKSFADTISDKNGVELERPVTAIKGIINAVNGMSPRKDLLYIIEGIETGDRGITQLQVLEREGLGDLLVQGYVGGIPVSIKDFIKKIDK